MSDTQRGSPHGSLSPTTFPVTSLSVVSKDLHLSVMSTDTSCSQMECLESIGQFQLKFLSTPLVLQLPLVESWSLAWVYLASSRASD